MKQGWEIKKLGEVCEKSSSNVSQNAIEHLNGVYPIFGARGFIKNVDFYHQEKSYIGIIKDGAGVGKTMLIDGFSSVIGTMQYLIPNENINIKYFHYFLQSINFTKYINGSTIPHIYFKDYKNEIFLLPPLSEQEKIVAALNKVFSAIDQAKQNAEKNLKNVRELFDGYLNDIFTNKGDDWEEKTLAQISTLFGRGKSKHRPRNDKVLYGGNYPFIQTGDISNCAHLINKYSQTYNEVGLAQSKLWAKGTICITIAANIAETGILTFDACFPDSVIGLEVNEELADNHFVEYLLQSFKVKLQALSKGSAQANINMGTFEKEFFPFPQLLEQKEIVQILDALSVKVKSLEAIYKQKLMELGDLKKSILQKAFNGELIREKI